MTAPSLIAPSEILHDDEKGHRKLQAKHLEMIAIGGTIGKKLKLNIKKTQIHSNSFSIHTLNNQELDCFWLLEIQYQQTCPKH